MFQTGSKPTQELEVRTDSWPLLVLADLATLTPHEPVKVNQTPASTPEFGSNSERSGTVAYFHTLQLLLRPQRAVVLVRNLIRNRPRTRLQRVLARQLGLSSIHQPVPAVEKSVATT